MNVIEYVSIALAGLAMAARVGMFLRRYRKHGSKAAA